MVSGTEPGRKDLNFFLDVSRGHKSTTDTDGFWEPMESGQGVNPRVAVVTAWSLFILMMQSVSNYDSDIFFYYYYSYLVNYVYHGIV